MKKVLILLALVWAINISAQETEFSKNSIKFSDFVKEDTRMRITEKPFYFRNGDNKLSEALVTISYSVGEEDKINLEALYNMVIEANRKSRESVKNKYTYVSKIIKLSTMKDGTWNVSIEYTAQNDYGATKDGLNTASFDYDGNLIKFSTLL